MAPGRGAADAKPGVGSRTVLPAEVRPSARRKVKCAARRSRPTSASAMASRPWQHPRHPSTGRREPAPTQRSSSRRRCRSRTIPAARETARRRCQQDRLRQDRAVSSAKTNQRRADRSRCEERRRRYNTLGQGFSADWSCSVVMKRAPKDRKPIRMDAAGSDRQRAVCRHQSTKCSSAGVR